MYVSLAIRSLFTVVHALSTTGLSNRRAQVGLTRRRAQHIYDISPLTHPKQSLHENIFLTATVAVTDISSSWQVCTGVVCMSNVVATANHRSLGIKYVGIQWRCHEG